jgi:Zn-dependent protease with chaperone function
VVRSAAEYQQEHARLCASADVPWPGGRLSPPAPLADVKGRVGYLVHELYVGLLFLLIIGYYLSIVWGLGQAISFTLEILDLQMLSHPVWVVAAYLWLGLVLPVARDSVWCLWQGIRGLVTPLWETHEHQCDILLDEKQYSLLYQAVADVALRIEAPIPDEIRVTHMPDCYVTEHRVFSIVPARKLVLVLGMPQLTVFTLDELQVTLAHELAHFRRGDTRTGVFAQRFLNALRWTVGELGRHRYWWLNPLWLYARLYALLFMVASAPMRRAQELHADDLSARAFGGELAAQTLLKEWLIAHQFDAAVATYHTQIVCEGPGSEPPNVFQWFGDAWRELSPAGQEYLVRRLAEVESPTFWDSHPSTSARIGVMRRYPQLPSTSSVRASDLIPDFEGLQARLARRLRAG